MGSAKRLPCNYETIAVSKPPARSSNPLHLLCFGTALDTFTAGLAATR